MSSFAQKWIVPYTMVVASDSTALSVWKAWFQDLDAHILASGMVQTADTGQLDFTTITTTGAAGTPFGYRLYAFNDALQSTMPIIVKVTFTNQWQGGTADAARIACIKVDIGVATNGAGVLTSTLVTASFPSNFNSNGSGVIGTFTPSAPCAICYNETAGFFGLMYAGGMRNKTNGDSFMTVFIQRSVDATGVPTGSGFTVYIPVVGGAGNDTGAYYCQGLYYDGTTSYTGPYWAARVGANTYSSPASGPQVQRAWTMTPYIKPMPSLMTFNSVDIPSMTEFTFSDNSVSRNFIALPNKIGACIDPAVVNSSAFAMLFQ